MVPAGTSAEGSLPAEEDSRPGEGSHPVAFLAVEGSPVPGTAAEGSLQKAQPLAIRGHNGKHRQLRSHLVEDSLPSLSSVPGDNRSDVSSCSSVGKLLTGRV